MNNLLARFNNWLANHKPSSHAIAGAMIGFLGLYTGDKAFADYVNGLLAHWPNLIAGLTVAAGVYLRYSNSKK